MGGKWGQATKARAEGVQAGESAALRGTYVDAESVGSWLGWRVSEAWGGAAGRGQDEELDQDCVLPVWAEEPLGNTTSATRRPLPEADTAPTDLCDFLWL